MSCTCSFRLHFTFTGRFWWYYICSLYQIYAERGSNIDGGGGKEEMRFQIIIFIVLNLFTLTRTLPTGKQRLKKHSSRSVQTDNKNTGSMTVRVPTSRSSSISSLLSKSSFEFVYERGNGKTRGRKQRGRGKGRRFRNRKTTTTTTVATATVATTTATTKTNLKSESEKVSGFYDQLFVDVWKETHGDKTKNKDSAKSRKVGLDQQLSLQERLKKTRDIFGSTEVKKHIKCSTEWYTHQAKKLSMSGTKEAGLKEFKKKTIKDCGIEKATLKLRL